MRPLAQACHFEPTAAVTAITVALAASTGRPWPGTFLAGSAVLAGQLTIGWHNDWLDAERDRRAARPDKPIARGDIARREVGIAALCASVAVVPLSLASGWVAGLAHIGAVGFALAYNARLKATVASFVPYAVAFPLLVCFISLGANSSRWPPWWALVGASALGTGAHLANAAPDLAYDLSAGIRGLPQLLGRGRSILGALGLMVASSAVMILGMGAKSRSGLVGEDGPASIALLVFAVVSVLLALVGLLAIFAPLSTRASGGAQSLGRFRQRAGPRALFRVVMLVALADVALLVARGQSL